MLIWENDKTVGLGKFDSDPCKYWKGCKGLMKGKSELELEEEGWMGGPQIREKEPYHYWVLANTSQCNEFYDKKNKATLKWIENYYRLWTSKWI